MVRSSRLARKARREHERQQESLRKQHLPICEGCHLCFAINSRRIKKATGESRVLSNQPLAHQQRRRKLRLYLKRNLFEADILIVPRRDPHVHMANDLGFGAEQDRSVYWTDASKLQEKDSCCGIGVAYLSSAETWAELSWSIRPSTDTYVLEICAIAKALEIARERCRYMKAEQRPSSVCIYSDCSDALKYFQQLGPTLAGLGRFPYGEELVGPGLLAAEELSTLKIAVELRYVPGHTGVLGNVKADRAAKRGAKHSVGARKASRLMILCGGRKMLSSEEAQAFTPFPWRTHVHPST
ncbi:MAG: hypothetical protein LQ337_000535 [Flavoplaca oasis]|nr:MAG: hypothetical protein LQ337_000535 [Flavoplaca oasis]